MYERCRGVWPERFRHGYAHYSGAFMEEYFFRHWTASRPALPQVRLADKSQEVAIAIAICKVHVKWQCIAT